MQQMEEGTKLIHVDPDSKTPYSDVTQVSFNFILTFEKPFLTISPEDKYNNAFKQSVNCLIEFQLFKS